MGIWAARPFVISYGAQRLFRHVAGCDTCMLMPLCIFLTSHSPKTWKSKGRFGPQKHATFGWKVAELRCV